MLEMFFSAKYFDTLYEKKKTLQNANSGILKFLYENQNISLTSIKAF